MGLEVANMKVTVESWVGEYKVKIEKGDLRQGFELYQDAVRRVTLTDSAGQEVERIFRGHDCTKKATLWLVEASNGKVSADGAEWMWQ